MGLEISKRFSYSFHLMSAKLLVTFWGMSLDSADVILHSMLPHNLHDSYYYQLAKSPITLIDIEDMFQNLYSSKKFILFLQTNAFTYSLGYTAKIL